MIGHGSKFGRNKEQAIASLLLHRNLEDAAKAAGISAATLKRWKQLPEFKAAYLEARKELVFHTNARMQQNCGAAATVLFKLMADPATPASIRARTAQCVVECANSSLEVEDFEVRLARLEEKKPVEKADVG